MELLNQYIALPVALGVFVIMEIIKRTLPNLESRYIPVISAFLGVFFVLWNRGFDLSFDTFLLGVISGGSSTWLYEVIDQFMKVEEK